jgi:hypothetical protein
MYVKLLNGLGLLGFLAVVAITLTGQAKSVESFFAPGGDLEQGVEKTIKSPVDKARRANASTKIEYLLRSVPLETVGQSQVNEAELESSLKASEPGSGLGQPLAKGGVRMDVIGGRLVLFCAKPSNYYCASYEIVTRISGRGEGPTLAAAQKEAR